MKNNRIDVIIPTYNSSKYLSGAIKSALNQRNVELQVLIIDDGSTDNTRQLVKSLSSKNAVIKYFYQPNRGLSSARNLGIKVSEAPYIAFLDADDIWLPEKIAKQLAIFTKSKNDSLGLVYCDYFDIDVNGQKIPYPSMRLDPSVKGKVYSRLLAGNLIAGSGSGVLVKRECFDKLGGFDENLPTCEDWDMWLRISKQYQVDYTIEKLVGIRRSSNTMSSNNAGMLLGMALLYDKNVDFTNSSQAKEYFYTILMKTFFQKSKLRTTLIDIKKGISSTTYTSLFSSSIMMIKIFVRESVFALWRGIREVFL
jgi:glycosyltransferase involved in cell wall biosynthesis